MKRSIYAIIIFLNLILTNCINDDIPPRELKLNYYIESFEVAGLDFEPARLVTYKYDAAGRLDGYTTQVYDPVTKSYDPQNYFVFHYSDNKVERINGFLEKSDAPFIEYSYTYLSNGNVLKIKEKNNMLNISADADFTYAENEIVRAVYTYSTGAGFEYEFDFSGKNIVSDKITRGSQPCSDGRYTYDQRINPLHTLGYVDFLLSNFSINNKLTEKVNYAACYFPSDIPLSYSYEYNESGYPKSATTFYQSGGNLKKSKRDFFYTDCTCSAH